MTFHFLSKQTFLRRQFALKFSEIGLNKHLTQPITYLLHPNVSLYKNFASSKTMSKKTAILLLADGAEEMEAVITVDVLRRAEIDVTVASISAEQCVKCSRNVKICADAKLEEIPKNTTYDAVILPGGLGGSKALGASSAVGSLLKNQESGKRVIAAICAAPTSLQVHGIGKGKRLTSYPSMKKHLTTDYEYKDEKVVVDDNLITSQGPATAYDFALAIVEKLLSKEIALTVAKQLLYENYK